MLFPREAVKYARSSTLDPFAADAAVRLQADPAAGALLREAATAGQGVPGVLLALQALRVAGASGRPPGEAEFVATVPPGTPCPARPTQVVLREMLSGPRREIVALGYEISEPGVIALLHEAALVCSRTILLCDRGRGSALKLRAGWPRDRYGPELYENVEVAASTISSMHCKTLLVDGDDLLVTSANFTFHGIGGNIEFGVRLRGAEAQASRSILLALLGSGLFRRVPDEGA